ncbi:MAG: hypothetical protein U0Y08_13885 [Bacteroidia bacterium]
MNYLKYTFALLLSASLMPALAQDDADKILAEAEHKDKTLTIATFKTTRVVNFHTIEVCGPRTLDVRISPLR